MSVSEYLARIEPERRAYAEQYLDWLKHPDDGELPKAKPRLPPVCAPYHSYAWGFVATLTGPQVRRHLPRPRIRQHGLSSSSFFVHSSAAAH
jgi:hypothetical protein